MRERSSSWGGWRWCRGGGGSRGDSGGTRVPRHHPRRAMQARGPGGHRHQRLRVAGRVAQEKHRRAAVVGRNPSCRRGSARSTEEATGLGESERWRCRSGGGRPGETGGGEHHRSRPESAVSSEGDTMGGRGREAGEEVVGRVWPTERSNRSVRAKLSRPRWVGWTKKASACLTS
jgi:hypothetical protein